MIRFILITLVLMMAFSFGPGNYLYAQEEKGPTLKYFGVQPCLKCHLNGPKSLLCDCDEAKIWLKEDKHKDAFNVLTKPRSQKMGEILKIKPWKEQSCISCHSVHVTEGDPEKITDPSFKIEDGVSCVVCHGPYRDWVNKHAAPLEEDIRYWRGLSPETKEKKYGLTNLWDPLKRAKVCASCHIGNIKEGKFVTHEMYAAGHPPLPGFDAATFSDAMPRHWKYLGEKSAEVQKLYHFDPSILERTQLVTLGSLVSYRESLNLVADQAQNSGKNAAAFPDLALYDCFACHHDLNKKSWRQDRGYFGLPPGRLGLRPWPLPIVKLGFFHSGNEKQVWNDYREEMKKFNQVFASHPFGDPKNIGKAAQSLAGWIDLKIGETRKKDFDKAAVQKLLKRLQDIGGEKYLDYDSARQVVWALRIFKADIDGKYKDEEKVQLSDDLKKMFQIDLPKGQVEIVSGLEKSLEKINNFNPEDFPGTFHAWVKELSLE